MEACANSPYVSQPASGGAALPKALPPVALLAQTWCSRAAADLPKVAAFERDARREWLRHRLLGVGCWRGRLPQLLPDAPLAASDAAAAASALGSGGEGPNAAGEVPPLLPMPEPPERPADLAYGLALEAYWRRRIEAAVAAAPAAAAALVARAAAATAAAAAAAEAAVIANVKRGWREQKLQAQPSQPGAQQAEHDQGREPELDGERRQPGPEEPPALLQQRVEELEDLISEAVGSLEAFLQQPGARLPPPLPPAPPPVPEVDRDAVAKGVAIVRSTPAAVAAAARDGSACAAGNCWRAVVAAPDPADCSMRHGAHGRERQPEAAQEEVGRAADCGAALRPACGKRARPQAQRSVGNSSSGSGGSSSGAGGSGTGGNGCNALGAEGCGREVAAVADQARSGGGAAAAATTQKQQESRNGKGIVGAAGEGEEGDSDDGKMPRGLGGRRRPVVGDVTREQLLQVGSSAGGGPGRWEPAKAASADSGMVHGSTVHATRWAARSPAVGRAAEPVTQGALAVAD
jgi:hypothetical protein